MFKTSHIYLKVVDTLSSVFFSSKDIISLTMTCWNFPLRILCVVNHSTKDLWEILSYGLQICLGGSYDVPSTSWEVEKLWCQHGVVATTLHQTIMYMCPFWVFILRPQIVTTIFHFDNNGKLNNLGTSTLTTKMHLFDAPSCLCFTTFIHVSSVMALTTLQSCKLQSIIRTLHM